MYTATEEAIRRHMNVSQFDEYIEQLVSAEKMTVESPKRKPKPIASRGFCRDIRLYSNTIDQMVKMMRTSGLSTEFERSEDESRVVFTIVVEKN